MKSLSFIDYAKKLTLTHHASPQYSETDENRLFSLPMAI